MKLWRSKSAEPEGALPARRTAAFALAAAACALALWLALGSPDGEGPAGRQPAPPATPNEDPAATAAQAGAAVDDAADRERAALAAQAMAELEEARRAREDPAAQQRELDRQRAEDALRGTGWPMQGDPPPPQYPAGPYGPAPVADVDAEFALQQRRAMQVALSSSPVAHSVRSQAAAEAALLAPAPSAQPPPAPSAPPAAPPAPGSPIGEGPAAPEPAPAPDRPALPAAIPRPDAGAGMEVIDEGSIAEAVLITEIRADFAGPVQALVNIPLWSRDRQRVLIPRGTKALGSAGPVQGWGQSRLAVSFHRLILPSGERVELEFQGLSQAGAASLKDRVNRHYLSTFGAAGAVGLVAGLSQIGAQRPSLATPGDARFVAGQRMGDAAGEIFQRYLNRPPSITIRAGHRVRIYFSSDAAVPRRFPPG